MAVVLLLLVYFAVAWAVLRVTTGWDTRELLIRTAIITAVCNLPLLIGAPAGFIVYALVSVVVMRTLISSFDLGFFAAFLAIVAASLGSLGMMFVLA